MPLEIPCAVWNLQAAFCRYLPPCPHSPPYFPSLHASRRAHTVVLQRAGGREEKKGERSRGEVLIRSNWGPTMSELTCRRPGIKCIPFSLCHPGTDSPQSLRVWQTWWRDVTLYPPHSHPPPACVLIQRHAQEWTTASFYLQQTPPCIC